MELNTQYNRNLENDGKVFLVRSDKKVFRFLVGICVEPHGAQTPFNRNVKKKGKDFPVYSDKVFRSMVESLRP